MAARGDAVMDVLIGKYAGHTWDSMPITTAPGLRAGLRTFVAKEWPDIRFPADIVIMPREDYEIIQGDLVGQIYTPHRAAISLRILAEDPKPPRNHVKEWLEALIKITGIITWVCLLANAVFDTLK